MSVEMMSLVFKRYPVGGNEYVLALALADHAHDDGSRIFPSLDSLAKKSRQSRSSVQRHLARMVKSGWLMQVGKGGNGARDTNEYRINPAWIGGADFNSLVPPPVDNSPSEENKGVNLTPLLEADKGVKNEGRVSPGEHLKGVIAVTPKPSENHQLEPSQCAGAREAVDNSPPAENPPSVEKPPGKAPSENENARSLLAEFGIPPKLASSLVRIRNRKRLAITRQVLEGIKREAESLGLTLVEAVEICCERAWGSFRAKWDEAQEAAADLLRRKNPDAVAQGPPKTRSSGGDWRNSAEGVMAKGAELGIAPNPGESGVDYRKRVEAADWERKKAQLAPYRQGGSRASGASTGGAP